MAVADASAIDLAEALPDALPEQLGSEAMTESCVSAIAFAMAFAELSAAVCAWVSHGHVVHCATALDIAFATAFCADELAEEVAELEH